MGSALPGAQGFHHRPRAATPTLLRAPSPLPSQEVTEQTWLKVVLENLAPKEAAERHGAGSTAGQPLPRTDPRPLADCPPAGSRGPPLLPRPNHCPDPGRGPAPQRTNHDPVGGPAPSPPTDQSLPGARTCPPQFPHRPRPRLLLGTARELSPRRPRSAAPPERQGAPLSCAGLERRHAARVLPARGAPGPPAVPRLSALATLRHRGKSRLRTLLDRGGRQGSRRASFRLPPSQAAYRSLEVSDFSFSRCFFWGPWLRGWRRQQRSPRRSSREYCPWPASAPLSFHTRVSARDWTPLSPSSG